ncbi:MAG TPA: hypothetical protein DEP05_09890 [Betaproteobacteria bacterium]|nr:hypothetical protein [Betaproteobacteria bacterium]
MKYSVLLAALLALSLTGCGKKQEASTPAAAPEAAAPATTAPATPAPAPMTKTAEPEHSATAPATNDKH